VPIPAQAAVGTGKDEKSAQDFPLLIPMRRGFLLPLKARQNAASWNKSYANDYGIHEGA